LEPVAVRSSDPGREEFNMCEIVVLIGMLVMGIYTLVTGKIKLSARKIVEGGMARLIGLILMVPLPLTLGIGLILGIAAAAQNPQNPQAHIPAWAAFIGIGSAAICAITAILIAVATAKPVVKEPGPSDFARKSDID
jgi:hypothetical protein